MDHASMDHMDMGAPAKSGHDHSKMGHMMNTFFVASTPNMPLWFSGWTPSNAGAAFAACLGLFLITLGVKLLGALRHQAHLAWSMNKWHDSGIATIDKNDPDHNNSGGHNPKTTLRATRPPVPWAARHDIPRGILAGIHVGLEYFLMLAVMTYNVYYFIAIIFGHIVGETLFGRWSTVQGAHC